MQPPGPLFGGRLKQAFILAPPPCSPSPSSHLAPLVLFFSDVDLAKAERVQLLTQAETSLKMAEINSNKTVAKANADAAAIEAESQSRYDAIKASVRLG